MLIILSGMSPCCDRAIDCDWEKAGPMVDSSLPDGCPGSSPACAGSAILIVVILSGNRQGTVESDVEMDEGRWLHGGVSAWLEAWERDLKAKKSQLRLPGGA
jgi:hypothetical protein